MISENNLNFPKFLTAAVFSSYFASFTVFESTGQERIRGWEMEWNGEGMAEW